MRLLCALVLTTCLLLLSSAAGEAGIQCGVFDGSFTCKRTEAVRSRSNKVPGNKPSPGNTADVPPAAAQDYGAGAGAPPPPPGTYDAGTAPQTPPPAATAATCPASSELLGGHCIPYTQTCRSGLAANANPQPCSGTEEKQVCSIRADGLKDCCCRTYAKF